MALPMLLSGRGAESPTRFADSLDPLAPEHKGTVIRIPAVPPAAFGPAPQGEAA